MLAELDEVREAVTSIPERTARVGHVEVDLTYRRGLTVRGWAGRYQPQDTGEEGTDQYGLAVDYTPWPGLQIRAYWREEDGPASVEGASDDEAALEVHVYF